MLQNDRKMIEKAARAAQKAVDHVLGVTLGVTFDGGDQNAPEGEIAQ